MSDRVSHASDDVSSELWRVQLPAGGRWPRAWSWGSVNSRTRSGAGGRVRPSKEAGGGAQRLADAVGWRQFLFGVIDEQDAVVDHHADDHDHAHPSGDGRSCEGGDVQG